MTYPAGLGGYKVLLLLHKPLFRFYFALCFNDQPGNNRIGATIPIRVFRSETVRERTNLLCSRTV
jgi:hypothetical protein